MDKPLCVVLDRRVALPGDDHEPNQFRIFRAEDRSVDDTVTEFFGLNIGPPNTVLEVSNDNIRSVAVLGGGFENPPEPRSRGVKNTDV